MSLLVHEVNHITRSNGCLNPQLGLQLLELGRKGREGGREGGVCKWSRQSSACMPEIPLPNFFLLHSSHSASSPASSHTALSFPPSLLSSFPSPRPGHLLLLPIRTLLLLPHLLSLLRKLGQLCPRLLNDRRPLFIFHPSLGVQLAFPFLQESTSWREGRKAERREGRREGGSCVCYS